MRFFSLKAAILMWFLYFLISSLIMGYINAYFGLQTGIYISAIIPLPPIIYFLVYVWKWNKGEAEFP